jgi:hypothetical protein
MLEMALRETTNPGERENALVAIRRAADSAGGMAEYIRSIVPARSATPQPFQTFSEARAEKMRLTEENITLTATVEQQKQEIVDLERDVARLTAEIATLLTKNKNMAAASSKKIKVQEDGSMPYTEWAALVSTRTGAYHRWQAVFEDQTGLPRSRIQFFRLRGWVDADYVTAIAELQPAPPPKRHKEKWSLPEVRRLRALIDEGKTEKEAAVILTDEFERIFTDNMIKRTKLDSRARTGVFTNPAFGPEIGQSRKQ